MSDCQDCKDYRECDGFKEWFHFGEIGFCPFQCIWIIANADTFRAGHWPKNPDRADDNNTGSRAIKTEATFTKPILILAEVESRLRRTGINGKLLASQIEAGKTLETLDRDAKDALLYIKGFRRKRMSFSHWKRQRNYRSNEYKKVIKEGINDRSINTLSSLKHS